MPRWPIFYFLLALVLSSCRGQTPHDCPFPIASHAPTDRCGYLRVPADRRHPERGHIELAYLVLRSQSQQRQPDPIVYLQGGPGGSVLSFLDTYRQFAFDSDRDFILFDPRGTGYSGALCPDLGTRLLAVLAADLSSPQEAARLDQAAATCRQQLRGEGIAPNGYSTRENAADLEALRRHLGYRHWNLFGGSYGSRLALTYLDRYPDAVRSAVLVGVFPPQVRMYDRIVSNFDRALQRIFSACAADPACADRYPDLPGTLSQVLAQLRSTPLHYTWRGQDFTLNAQDLLLFLHQSLYDRRTAGTIPALLAAVRAGRTEPLITVTTATAQRLAVINMATYWSVMAGDEGAYPNREKVLADLARVPAYRGEIGFFLSDPQVLRNWRDSTAAGGALRATRSAVPVLLASGAHDPITPPAYAERAAASLPNGQVVVFANEGHAPLTPCFFQLARAFVRQPEQPVDTTCAGAGQPFIWR